LSTTTRASAAESGQLLAELARSSLASAARCGSGSFETRRSPRAPPTAVPASLRDVAAGVHDQAVEPRRELRLAANCRTRSQSFASDSCAASRRPRGRAADVRELLDARRVPLAEGLERLSVAVLRPFNQDGSLSLSYRSGSPPQRLTDSTAFAWRLHDGPSLVICCSRPTPEAVLPLLTGRLGRPYRFLDECASNAAPAHDDAPTARPSSPIIRPKGEGRSPELGAAPHECPDVRLPATAVDACPLPELTIVGRRARCGSDRRRDRLDTLLKHPNDCRRGRKVAACWPRRPKPRRRRIGVNVNQTDSGPNAASATSLRLETAVEHDRARLSPRFSTARPPLSTNGPLTLPPHRSRAVKCLARGAARRPRSRLRPLRVAAAPTVRSPSRPRRPEAHQVAHRQQPQLGARESATNGRLCVTAPVVSASTTTPGSSVEELADPLRAVPRQRLRTCGEVAVERWATKWRPRPGSSASCAPDSEVEGDVSAMRQGQHLGDTAKEASARST